jgi:6-phosphogluconolactonase
MKSILVLLWLVALNVFAQTERFYLGTYTDKPASRGIYTGTLDARTGRLGPITLAAAVKSPSYLAVTRDGQFLYAVTATNGGTIAAFLSEMDGRLTLLNELPSGNVACHVSVNADGHNVIAACYGGGNIVGFQTRCDGSLAAQTAVIPFTGQGPDPQRQTKPYLHATYLDADDRFLYACDLGTDHIWLFDFDPATGSLTRAQTRPAAVPPGSGPRHLAFSPDEHFVYVNGEMGLNVTTFARATDTGELSPLQTVSVLPPGAGTNGLTSAEIICHQNGKWLYVSNRDVAGKGRDNITVFEINQDGTLALQQNFLTPVKVPRGFGLDPSGQWLVVGGQADNQIVVLKIDAETGKLSATDQTAAVGAPVCVVFTPTKS